MDERTNEILTIKLRYKLPEESASTLLTHSLQDRRTDPSETSENFRFASAVAQFGMMLRDLEFKGSSSFDGILELARGSIGSDLQGYRTEFVQLVESCKMLVR